MQGDSMTKKIIFIVFMLFISNFGFAWKTETTPEIEINVSNVYENQYLSAFYVQGRTVISFSGEQIHISEIKADFDSIKISNKTKQEIPSITISSEGFSHAFNYLVIIIHPEASFTWKNADGSLPKNSVKGNSTDFTKVVFLSRSEINKIKKEKNGLFSIKINID
jgi:hypothetical protein